MYLRLNGRIGPQRKEPNTVNLHHHTETATALLRSPTGRRVGMLGVATAAIIGVAVGPAATANSATPHTAAPTATVSWATGTPTTTSHTPTGPAPQAPQAPHAPTVKAPAKHAPAVKVPSTKALLPHAAHGPQASFKPTAAQKRNAAAIVKAAKDMKLPPRAMVMAVACSLQESSLHNYGNLGNRNDHDSLGLFQQRPSSGWGSPAQVTNPHHAAQSFLKRLVKIHNWQHMPLTLAVQKVQVSAFPQAYAKWEKFAASLVAGSYAADAHHAANAAAHAATTVPAPGK
jgi:hypothetical protein